MVRKGDIPTEAVAVVEVHSRSSAAGSITNLTLIAHGKPTVMKRGDSIAVFDKTRLPHESLGAYYLNDIGMDRFQQWDSVLPRGMIRLRIQADVSTPDRQPESCRVTIGKHVLEAPLTFGPWAS